MCIRDRVRFAGYSFLTSMPVLSFMLLISARFENMWVPLGIGVAGFLSLSLIHISMKMLLGLTKPTSGEVKIWGKSLQGNEKKLLPRIGSLIAVSYTHLTRRLGKALSRQWRIAEV